MGDIETVILKNGQEEIEELVVVTHALLSELSEKHPLVFFDLVERCRGVDRVLMPQSEELLKDWRLLEQDGKVHASIRNVVVSAVTGDGLGMVLESPVIGKDGEDGK